MESTAFTLPPPYAPSPAGPTSPRHVAPWVIFTPYFIPYFTPYFTQRFTPYFTMREHFRENLRENSVAILYRFLR